MGRRGYARNRRIAALTAGSLLAGGMVLGGLPGTVAPAQAAVTPAPNPPIADSCGVDVTLVLDASGSISSSGAVESVRGAADTFLGALNNTDSTARVTQFATVSQELAARTLIDDAALAQGGALRQALNGYYNPKPPRPNGVDFYQYNNGRFSLNNANSNNQYTNWDGSLDQAGQEATKPELVVYVTDGDPTAYDFSENADPPSNAAKSEPYDVGFNTGSLAATLDRAVLEANQIKAGSRMLAVGVGSALSSSSSRSRLVAISGPQVVRDADLATIDSINDVDVALVTDFEDLAQFLRQVVLELCSPSMTITKLAQTPGDASYQPAPGWNMTVTPTVPGGTFSWILPDTLAAPSKTVATNANGNAQFQWEPDPGELDSVARVEEALQPGYIPGRPPVAGLPPGETDDYRCEAKNEFGDVRVITGELDTTGANPAFTLRPVGQEVVTCKIWNSFNYAPAIGLTKENDPAELRGDLDPQAELTSDYLVTNPGNTPLDNIVLTDDKCAPVEPTLQGGNNVGDTNGDGRLDVGEEWEYSCTRGISTSPSTDPSGTTIENVATVTGTDPEGTEVTQTATDSVDAFNPAIELTKLVRLSTAPAPGSKSITVPAGSNVTYSFDVKNAGNTPLGTVSMTDVSTPPTGCTPTRGPDGPGGNNDTILDVGETWTYSCSVSISQNTTNAATVTGTPLNPNDGNNPFPTPNPPVTATDNAEVTTIDPQLSLTKEADQSVVFPGTTVTYTYTAKNEGDTDLRNDTANPGWLTDDRCSPVGSVSANPDKIGDGVPSVPVNAGDVNGDDLLNPEETWRFACSADISVDTLNTATMLAQPLVGGQPQGTPLERHAFALVEIVQPDITVDKVALKPVVLDPDTVILDPDTGILGPTPPDPAVYLYGVSNTGDVPLRDIVIDDDTCAPLTFLDGDTNDDGNLDVDEVWIYGCLTPLQRQQGTPPPTGAMSGLVTNTASVEGTPFLPGGPIVTTDPVADTAQAQVLVIEPSISITKAADPEVVRVGGEVTYTFKVTNTGDVGLRVVGPTDDKCAPLVYVDGDVNGNDLLDGANSTQVETWTYTCTRSLGLPVAPATTDVNTASVRGVDPLGNIVFDQDDAEVRVIDPAIKLVKEVSDSLVPTGTEVSYEFVVTNVGTSPLAADDVLAEVTLADVADPQQPSCSRPKLVAKEGGNQDAFLDRDPAETWRYSCSSTIKVPTTNVAVVGALGGGETGLQVPVFDIAAAYVGTFNPGIDVVKSASPTVIFDSGPVTYTYTVKNTGDVPLAGVKDRITDNTCSPVKYVSGDEDGDGLLDTPNSIFEDSLDETWTFTCTTTVSTTTTNSVVTPGTPVDPGGEPLCRPTPVPVRGLQAAVLPASCDVTDSAKETVTVVKPATITIIKRAEPASGEVFGFTLGADSFGLASGASKTFPGLKPGTYEAREQVLPGWELVGLACTDPTGDTRVSVGTGLATINVSSGESVTCTYTNQQEITEPTEEKPPPDRTEEGQETEEKEELADTGADIVAALLVALLGVVLIGTGMRLSANRR